MSTNFFTHAHRILTEECGRLCRFTDRLDQDKDEKKLRFIEYKCAHLRYAAVSSVLCALQNNRRGQKRQDLSATHHLLPPFDEILQNAPAHLARYDGTPESGLYCGLCAHIDVLTADLRAKRELASDWERIELDERLGGLAFAQSVLDEAWQTREEETP